MKIVLDGGHHPETAGKRAPDDSLREAQFNFQVAEYTREELLTYEGVQVLFTHDYGRDVPLVERTNKANEWDGDILVSIHANAFGDGKTFNNVRGIETYSWNGPSPNGDRLAIEIQRKMMEFTKHPSNRGHKQADFHMLREFKRAAALVECGFMTNREDLALLKSDTYRKTCAKAITAAIVGVYNLTKIKEEPFMLERAIVINSAADYPVAEFLARFLKSPIHPRKNAEETQVAKEIFVVGGTQAGLKGTNFIVLSGENRFETAAKVKAYIG
ncbi:Sporulation-specific N-acetylmuramoyl-L-alanine amidase [Bacillus sp. THAF10]|uniref:N-acetylmuramoyl-L-alanine amidase n=1 Tax=Bacillus sp. THAF10 TaxID=2587848 RepID=UPI001267E048|nr:N-acetylmuramoyl-L-alanine amidase [Bacillus sp. THAF10]QFT88968.1 Sporulation-specific N-acetylmuramoyl-L-alanine amidase [Bacillus sp. THAF10]